MTLLVFIKDNRNDLWAALSDCLITSDATEEGISLRTPNRSQNQRRTYGFTEVRLEEKLGLIGKNELFGWENSRHEARKTLGALLADPEKVSPDLFLNLNLKTAVSTFNLIQYQRNQVFLYLSRAKI